MCLIIHKLFIEMSHRDVYAKRMHVNDFAEFGWLSGWTWCAFVCSSGVWVSNSRVCLVTELSELPTWLENDVALEYWWACVWPYTNCLLKCHIKVFMLWDLMKNQERWFHRNNGGSGIMIGMERKALIPCSNYELMIQ